MTADLRTVPRPGIFSPIQYGAHVHDIQQVYGDRIVLMLHEETPSSPSSIRTRVNGTSYNRLGGE